MEFEMNDFVLVTRVANQIIIALIPARRRQSEEFNQMCKLHKCMALFHISRLCKHRINGDATHG